MHLSSVTNLTESTPDSARPATLRAGVGISVVLPVRNEQQNLEELDRELRETLTALGRKSEIIYADDHSTDNSPQILQRLLAAPQGQSIRTRVVTLRRNYGQTAALAAGIDLAEGEIIILLDADGQNDPADIPHLVEKLEQGFDVVSGWRRARKDVLVSRRVPSMLANWLISKFTGVRLHDCGCTLKAYRASLLRELRLYGDMHRFIPVFLAQLGARITEMEVNHRPRRGGVSKYGGERILKVLADLVLIFFMARFYTRPMHFFGKLGALFFFAATLTGFGMLCFKFGWLRWIGIDYTATFVETPLPALMATFVIGSANSFFFGILGEVLMRIHHESTGQLGYAVHKVDDSEEAAA